MDVSFIVAYDEIIANCSFVFFICDVFFRSPEVDHLNLIQEQQPRGLLVVSADNRWDATPPPAPAAAAPAVVVNSQSIVIQHNGPLSHQQQVLAPVVVPTMNVAHSRQSSPPSDNVEPIMIGSTMLNPPPSLSPITPISHNVVVPLQRLTPPYHHHQPQQQQVQQLQQPQHQPMEETTLLISAPERNNPLLDFNRTNNSTAYLNGVFFWPQKMTPKNQKDILSYLEADQHPYKQSDLVASSNEQHCYHGQLNVLLFHQ